jgi:hypothetical protein
MNKLTVKQMLDFIEKYQLTPDAEIRIQRIRDDDQLPNITRKLDQTEEYATATGCAYFRQDQNLYIDARY